MIRIIEDEQKIRRHQKRFINSLKRKLNLGFVSNIGYPGGTLTNRTIYYSEEYNIWLTIEKLGNRFWNGFGIGIPKNDSLEEFATEINFPLKGIDRRIAGIFGKDDEGNILVLHRGKIGGGSAGVGKKLFEDNYRGSFTEVIDGNVTSRVALIGELTSDKLPLQVASFVNEVKRIKKVTSTKTIHNLLPKKNDHVFNSEFAGTKTYSEKELITAKCNHGIVVNTLKDELSERNYTMANDRNRDLYIVNKKNEIHTVFEIKTDTSSQSIYRAIGQLILYSIGLKKESALFLVLPDKLIPEVENKIKSIGLKICYYYWKGDNPIFDLDKIFPKKYAN